MTPIKPEQIRWRVGSTSKDKSKGMLLGYIDSRTAMELLDSLDSEWRDEYRMVKIGTDEGIECALTVKGITRTDVGTPSNTEGLKGAYSDALKRAAVKHGIGRELYELPRIWVAIDNFGRPTAEPAFKNGRWVLPSGAGSVFYDHEPEPTKPAPPPASTARARLAEVASTHGISAADLERYAQQVGASKPATDEQIEQIIALIEQPAASAPLPAPQESTPSGDAGSATGPTPPADSSAQPEAVAAPPSDSPAAADPTIEDILAATGGELVDDMPEHGTEAYREWFEQQPREKRQALRAAKLGPSDKPKRLTASDPEPLTANLA